MKFQMRPWLVVGLVTLGASVAVTPVFAQDSKEMRNEQKVADKADRDNEKRERAEKTEKPEKEPVERSGGKKDI